LRTGLNWVRPVRLRATTAPTTPPAPIAALSTRRRVTHAEALDRGDDEEIVSMPRTRVWSQASIRTIRTAGVRAIVRAPTVRPVRRSTEAVDVRIVGTWTEAIDRAASAMSTAVPARAPTTPDVASSRPARAGPIRVPRPSAALEAILAATSSPGVRASHGRRLMWSGRVSPTKPCLDPHEQEQQRQVSGEHHDEGQGDAGRPTEIDGEEHRSARTGGREAGQGAISVGGR
jgi:hypothetical protein